MVLGLCFIATPLKKFNPICLRHMYRVGIYQIYYPPTAEFSCYCSPFRKNKSCARASMEPLAQIDRKLLLRKVMSRGVRGLNFGKAMFKVKNYSYRLCNEHSRICDALIRQKLVDVIPLAC